MRIGCGLFLCLLAFGQTPAPVYVSSSIVNAANGRALPLAPNTIVTLFGKGLATAAHSLSSNDMIGGELPTVFGGTGARVTVGGLSAQLFYVSENQINFLVPPQLKPGSSKVSVAVNGLRGNDVPIELAEASPALFQLDPDYAICTQPDGSLVDREHPAHPGDVVILYANGLGWTKPRYATGQIATKAAPLERLSDFRVTLNGSELSREAIQYAGIAPGFVGVYQINLILPGSLPADPEIRIGFGSVSSPEGIRLPLAP